jgi:hypothetical protein
MVENLLSSFFGEIFVLRFDRVTVTVEIHVTQTKISILSEYATVYMRRRLRRRRLRRRRRTSLRRRS